VNWIKQSFPTRVTTTPVEGAIACVQEPSESPDAVTFAFAGIGDRANKDSSKPLTATIDTALRKLTMLSLKLVRAASADTRGSDTELLTVLIN
jgi:hypothetical protein